MEAPKQLAQSRDIAAKVSRLLEKRVKIANEHYQKRVEEAQGKYAQALAPPSNPTEAWTSLWRYGVDFAQRSILFWDTLRERGNNYIEHVRAGSPPVLSFDYDMVLDARAFERPANYALVAIRPPQGVTVDGKRRPYIIIDPRAGHGPGIGGFKDDSQVGVALAAGHPVYFVIFFPEPEPGQTLLDVTEAEKRFVREVRERHPHSQKPAIVGNCQGGWAAMMLASADPDDTGPLVINGAPMSYWGGAWSEGEGDNPMRYSGGMLGGSWLASLTADMGNGVFDGAHLVQNFENLNPANTFFDKYYHVFANVDTEPPRFLEFERWWGGFYLMNREEIEWITRNLFVGNKLWKGGVQEADGHAFDLRRIKTPIILFASMGDNITPPQQAFNWVADVYGSTEEIKRRGQVIVGLLHDSVGHLGIFVSGKVAKKEHAQIVSVMQSIEMLPPGLYGMMIGEDRGADGKPEYTVEFREHSLEEIVSRLNRLQRRDEAPFEAVAAVSDFNQQAYELFGRPIVNAMANEQTAKILRELHPLRFQRWAISDMNPFFQWIGRAAEMVRAQRQALPADDPMRRVETLNAELTSASLDYYRAVRDAVTEAAFFTTYANVYETYLADQHEAEEKRQAPFDPRRREIDDALSRIAEGGYTEAFARIAYLLSRRGEPLPLARLTMRQELAKEYAELVPQISPDQWRRIRGEQEVIVSNAQDRAIATLPELLDAGERARLLALIDRVLGDKRVQQAKPTPEQLAMVERIRQVLSAAEPGIEVSIQRMEGTPRERQT
ncbi:MAG TPA: DUF3141 domain-containing protein [Burkholderiales bacterium]|nr:DUF3141 domain-containing protein [Burkholderiales bacterium]